MKFVDLSHPIFNGMATYPSDPDVVILPEKDINTDRTLLHSLKMGTHSGTHLDVPAHIIPNGKTLSDFHLEAFYGTGLLVDRKNYLELIASIEKPDIIIINTDWYNKINDRKTYFGKDRPEIPAKLVELIVKNNIKMFGCDLPSVDANGTKEKPVHRALLGNDVIIYESLTNLDQIPMLEPFQFIGFPLSFKNLDGSPVRAVALLD